MEAKQRVIYDNYHENLDFEEYRGYAFECYSEAYGWESASDVPDDEVYQFIADEDEYDWDAESANMECFFGNDKFLLMGTIGRWNGPAEGGFIFSSFNELCMAWRDCDYIKIYDVNGHFKIKCSHHDGTNLFEVRELTHDGMRYAERHEWDMDTRELHQKLWGSSKYSRLPHFAHKTYGCRKTEYEPDQKSA